MAQTFVTDGLEQLASAMVAGLYDGGTLINTIYRDAEQDLVAGKGDTVTIREPQAVEAQDFTGTATVDELSEGKISVPMNMQPYSQVKLTAKEETFDIEDFYAQVLGPQMAGIVEFLDTAVGAKLESTTGTAGAAAADGWSAAVLDARGELTKNKVPLASRYLAVAPDVASALLASNVFVTGNIEGAPSALANGIIGRLYGFTVVESPFITEATAVAYHRTAVAGIFRTPVPPRGAANASASLRGVSAQVVYSYSPSQLADVITCQALYGLGSSDVSFAQRAVKVTLSA